MYSLKETALNIHIKTKNTLKKSTSLNRFFFLRYVFVDHISYKTFYRYYIYIVQKKHTCCQWTYWKHFDGSHRNKRAYTAYLLSNQKYSHNPKNDIQYTVNLPSQGFTLHIQPDTLRSHTAPSKTGCWNLTRIHYRIPLSNWIPTAKMLKLSNGFKNRMIVFFFFKYNAKPKSLLYTRIYKGL